MFGIHSKNAAFHTWQSDIFIALKRDQRPERQRRFQPAVSDLGGVRRAAPCWRALMRLSDWSIAAVWLVYPQGVGERGPARSCWLDPYRTFFFCNWMRRGTAQMKEKPAVSPQGLISAFRCHVLLVVDLLVLTEPGAGLRLCVTLLC